jgi:hypothetical protein
VSEAREIMADVVDDRAPFTTDSIINLKTGQAFQAEIEPIEDLVLATELGLDPRASHWLHVARRQGVRLNAGDELKAIGSKFQVLQKSAPRNSANVMDKYLLMELTAKDAN